jgi:hypothetical protein
VAWSLACGEPAQHRFGLQVAGMLYAPVSARAGVHPDASIVADPNNPFRTAPLGSDTKWRLLEAGGSVAAFYAFATALVAEPTGEHQFYAAQLLAEIARTGSLVDLARRDEVLRTAVAGYQAVLDHFPDARGYDATGTTSYRLATPAYKAIVALGAKVEGDWVLVRTAAGEEAVRASQAAPEESP